MAIVFYSILSTSSGIVVLNSSSPAHRLGRGPHALNQGISVLCEMHSSRYATECLVDSRDVRVFEEGLLTRACAR